MRVFLKVVTTFVFYVTIPSVVSENFTCYDTQDDLKKACKDIYEGIVDGGQCFFVGGLGNSWSEGWTTCQERGATLAQLHTGSEFKKVSDYLQSYVPTKYGYNGQYTSAMIALRDYNTSAPSNDTESIKNATTYWFQNENGPSTSAADTYIRTHSGDDQADPSITPPRCFYLYKWFAKVVDHACNSPAVVLCQVSSIRQNFTKTRYCLTENPMETISASIPQDCANSCSERPWCRSFNVVSLDGDECSKECRLFSWSVQDECTNCASRNETSDNCVHYNYVP